MLLLLVQAPVVTPSPTPPITLQTALITAGALLVGVWITNWQQNRREASNFERQLTLYANQWGDQREKDAADREEQRRRDREQWAREDRHRFTEYKRDLYAEFLGYQLNRIIKVGLITTFVQGEHDRRTAANEDPLSSPRLWLIQKHRDAYKEANSDADFPMLEKIALMCPHAVAQSANALSGRISAAASKTANVGDTATSTKLHDEAVRLIGDLRRQMSADLTAV